LKIKIGGIILANGEKMSKEQIMKKIDQIEEQIKEEEFKFENAVFYRHKNLYEEAFDKIIDLENEKKHLMEELKGYIDLEEGEGVEEPMSLFEQTPLEDFNFAKDMEVSDIMTNKLSMDMKKVILEALATENAEEICKVADKLDAAGSMEAADVLSVVAEYKVTKTKEDKKLVAKFLRNMKKEAFELVPDQSEKMTDVFVKGIENSTSWTAQDIISWGLTFEELKYVYSLSKSAKNPEKAILGYLDMVGKSPK